MGFTEIRYEVDGPLATITLDRPDRLNAFTANMQAELVAAFDLADADDGVRAVIVTGAGRAFCAGADLGGGDGSFDRDRSDGEHYPRDYAGLVTLRIYECTKPVIAAINGAAVGVGLTMTLAMDYRLVADSTKLGFVFASRGIVPEGASSWFLPRIVGIATALDWCLSGRIFLADEALARGLVRSVHSHDELLPAARAIGLEIAANTAPVSVALTRQLLWRMVGADHPMEAHKVDSRGIYTSGRSADAREGVSAFLEKRRPVWTMRPSADMPDWYPWWEDREYR